MKKPGARDRILETAGQLFASKGYGNVGINEIIEKSGTAKASFYQHFPSKEMLCATWLEEAHRKSERRHDAMLKESGDALELLQNYFEELKEWLKSNDFRGCPYTNTAAVLLGGSDLILEKIEEHKLFLRDFFVEIARSFVGGIGARQLGGSLFLLYSGATTEAQNLRSTWPVDNALKAALYLCENVQKA